MMIAIGVILAKGFDPRPCEGATTRPNLWVSMVTVSIRAPVRGRRPAARGNRGQSGFDPRPCEGATHGRQRGP